MTKKIRKALIRLQLDESATAMIEYSMLLGLISVAVLGLVVFMGGWVTNQWSHLSSSLP